jgi:hypothetical protein
MLASRWKPTLVIWDTGTPDAVRGMELDEFRQTIQAGIDRLRESGAEVVADFVGRGAQHGTGSHAASSGSDK